MKKESIYLLSFALGMVVLLFLPALFMAGLRLAGFCPYSHEKHVLVSQWVQIVWMVGVTQLIWFQLFGRQKKKLQDAV